MALSPRLAAAAVVTLVSVTCAQAAPAASNPSPAIAAATAGAAIEGSPAAGAAPVVEAPDAAPITLVFGGLPQGAFPVHLHAACNATQAYHLGVLAPLVVDGGGSGAISVPAADLRRGWCAIVYSDATLTRVLALRPL